MRTGRCLLWIVALAFAGTAGALETMAYRFAVEPNLYVDVDRFSEDALLYPKELKEPPEPTCFADAEDRLRDVTDVFRKKGVPLKGGWVVWNETQRLLIAKGRMMEQWRIESLSSFEAQPIQVRVRYEWFSREGNLDPPSEEEQAVASLTVVGRSGQKASGELAVQDGDGERILGVVGEAFASPKSGVVDFRYSPVWSFFADDAKHQVSLSSACSSLDGQRLMLGGATVPGAASGWLVAATAEICLCDGTLWREARMREVDGKPVALPMASYLHGTARILRKRLEDGRFVLILPFAPDLLQSLIGVSEFGVEVDPFAPELESEKGTIEILVGGFGYQLPS